MIKRLFLAAALVCAAVSAWGQAGDRARACADVKQLSVDHVEIVKAAVVEAGKLDLGQKKPNQLLLKLPAFCRVEAISRPTSDSKIKIEVWLPLTGWNGKFMGHGNGGFAGSIGYEGLAVAVRSGFAGGGTDAGHTGGATDSDWALGHPEKVVDFGYRAVHEMTAFSKTVVEAFYAQPAKPVYFSSCSDGGREALMEAQRFPTDYDGILAGAPAYNWTSLLSRAALMSEELLTKPESRIPASKVSAINKAVLASCRKGEPGPFLDDPRTCHFDPETMVCEGKETDACLTLAQAQTVKDLYANSYTHDGKLVYHGLLPGGEPGDNGWPGWITGKDDKKSEGSKYATGYFANLVYSNPNWDLKSFDLDRDLKAAQAKTAQALDAVNPDLTAFKAHGGKLILYHGWNDPAISALGTIDYYKKVVRTVGEKETEDFARLFLVPGMQHCAGGPGPANFGQFGPTFEPGTDDAAHNITAALEDWVERGVAPEQVIATGILDQDGTAKKERFTEPICAYPKAAKYSGSGDKRDAANYACVTQ